MRPVCYYNTRKKKKGDTKMFKMFAKLFKKSHEVDNWFADFRMEDGRTGRVFSVYEIEAVENNARKAGHKAIYWSVNGGEWFNSWEWPGK